MKTLAACAAGCLLLLAGCALRPPHPEAFTFGVMGDTPYGEREEARFLTMIERMNAEPLAFVVHIGDFKREVEPCSDALYQRRKEQFNLSTHPLVYTPGDNDWTDCHLRGMDQIERLAKIRQVFFADEHSLGREKIQTAVQNECIERSGAACSCGPHPENRAWTRSRVHFITLNIPGSDNNVGFDAANDEEARCRDEANRRWLERWVAESEAAEVRALVVMTQANPWATDKPVYKPFVAQLAAAAKRLGKPLLFVHGDTHTYRVDNPFVDAAGQRIWNLTRLETYGSPWVGWVQVTVDPNTAEIFSFRPRIEAYVWFR